MVLKWYAESINKRAILQYLNEAGHAGEVGGAEVPGS